MTETFTYAFTDIPFFDNRSPYLFKKWLKVAQRNAVEMTPKYRRTEAQSWPNGSRKNNNI